MDVFAQLANTFSQVLAGGINALTPYAHFLSWGFMTLGLAWLCSSVAFNQGCVPSMATKLIATGGFYLVITDGIQQISELILSGAAQFGLLAGGSSLNPDKFLNSPDSIFLIGFNRSIDLAELADQSCGWVPLGGCSAHLGTFLPLTIASWSVFLTFAFIAAAVLLTFVLFKCTALAALVVLPAAMFAPSSGFANGVVRYAVHSAVQIMVLAMIVAIADLTFGAMTVHMVPGTTAASPFIIASIILLGATVGAMAIAHSIVSGAASSTAAFLAAPAAAAAGARSVAGHLDGPVSGALRTTAGGMGSVGAATFRAISSACNASQASIAGMKRPTMAANASRRA